MNKLEKYLAKATEEKVRKEVEVTIDGETWKVRELSMAELRACEREADKNDKFDWFRFNDARIVKATEHDFEWHNVELLKAYKVKGKYDLPEKMFGHDKEGYASLLAAVDEVNRKVKTEEETVEELKNS
ncbi:hypothetical protein B9C88_09630 [Brevibacillus laterosporus]|uniref:phage tail assembly chaperone n=1 Tax=Brevibacillus laterosporus TaxID=1465 RepID=UPI000BCFBEAC|nr:hypothetical protein [Brevibacillus laterosporus]PCN44466.1 hypothetical protein B9C88_09630 [Brevibacillus laterosporus]